MIASKTAFQQFVGEKPRNVAVVWQLQAMTGNDEQISEHGTDHGISGKRQEKVYLNQSDGTLVCYRVGVTGKDEQHLATSGKCKQPNTW